jgi:hypothetical protein
MAAYRLRWRGGDGARPSRGPEATERVPPGDRCSGRPSRQHYSAPVAQLCSNRHNRFAHNRHFSRSIGLAMLHHCLHALVIFPFRTQATSPV